MSTKTMICNYCGTEWTFDTRGGRLTGGMSGFIESTIYYHRLSCKNRTPRQRLAIINRHEKRLKKHPNLHTEVWFDRNHPGIQQEIMSETQRLTADIGRFWGKVN